MVAEEGCYGVKRECTDEAPVESTHHSHTERHPVCGAECVCSGNSGYLGDVLTDHEFPFGLLVTLQHRSFLSSPLENNKTSGDLTEMGFYVIVEG
jgi:hypothetical protein